MFRGRVTHFEHMGPSCWAIRFTSADTADFLCIKDRVKSYGPLYTAWKPDLFGGRGGWMIIARHVLKDLLPLLSNLKDVLDEETRRELFPSQQGGASHQQSATVPSRLVPYYLMLGLPVDHLASSDEIQIAYRSRAKLFHPDTGGAHQLMVALNYAYERLK